MNISTQNVGANHSVSPISGVGNLNYSTMANAAQKGEVNKTDASYQGKDLHRSRQPELTEEEIKSKKKIKDRERMKRLKIKEREKFLKEARGELIEDADFDESDPDGAEKTGYELTAYMIEFNKTTAFDQTKGYDPQKMDQIYKEKSLWSKKKSTMPQEVDFTFNVKISALNCDKETMDILNDCFDKFQSDNSVILKPKQMREKFVKIGLDKQYPSMYSMISWITDANEYSGTEGMTFEEFIQYAAYFFDQRDREEGLKYIFELWDPNQRGYIEKKQFDNLCHDLGFNIEKHVLNDIFKKASSDGKVLKFSEFAFFMRTEPK